MSATKKQTHKKISPYTWALIGLVAVIFLLHLSIIASPFDRYIYDESHYVHAAKCFLNGTACVTEHPPLAKAAILSSMMIFGDNGLGWRMPSIITGTLSIVIIYLIVRRLRNEKTAFISAFLLGFENLWFTHSSMAMLDIFMVFLVLLGIYFFIREQNSISGLLIGLAMLSKAIAVLIIPVILAYSFFIRYERSVKQSLKSTFKTCYSLVLMALIVFTIGLAVYGEAYDAFPSPFHSMARIVTHTTAYDSPHPAEVIPPFRWFSGFPAVPYLVTAIDTNKFMARTIYQYIGQANLVIILLVWLAVPFAISHARKKEPLELLSLLYLGITFAGFIIIGFIRITYPYYMLLFIPVVCILNATLLAKFPKNVIITYSVGVVLWFIFWFPRNIFTLGMS